MHLHPCLCFPFTISLPSHSIAHYIEPLHMIVLPLCLHATYVSKAMLVMRVTDPPGTIFLLVTCHGKWKKHQKNLTMIQYEGKCKYLNKNCMHTKFTVTFSTTKSKSNTNRTSLLDDLFKGIQDM